MKPSTLLGLTGLALLSACANCPDPAAHGTNAAQAANKKAYEAIQNAFSTGDGSCFDTLIADNFTMRIADSNLKSTTGKAVMNEALAMYHGSFPDMKVDIKRMVAEGDWVVGVQQVTGTNTVPMGDMPPTGRSIDVMAMDAFRFENGKAVENYGLFEIMKFMEQMGMGQQAAPPDSAAAPQ